MSGLEWKPEQRGEVAVLVIGGLLAVRLRVEAARWIIEGSDGRRRDGPAPSIEDAKRLCLRALATVLTSGTMQVSALQLALDG